MKPGDEISWPPIIKKAYLGAIDGDLAEVWWPCPEYGSHTRWVPKKEIVLIAECVGAAVKPKRIKSPEEDNLKVT